VSTPTQPDRPQPIILHRDGDLVVAEDFPTLTEITPALLGAVGQYVTVFIQFRASNASAEYIGVGMTKDGLLLARKFNRLGYPAEGGS
jgi:hypothetical protein